MSFRPISDMLPAARESTGLPSTGWDSFPESEKRHDCRDWARKILWAKAHGERISMLQEQFAKEALAAVGAKP